ncbi:MAG TPA: DUF6597 domain-containing transcriptional factor, partial [Ktedonobacterales bacterium]|nr:DUF6597 domain-containing transcriptional factor [Ktedonobacterales bacterium]
MTIHHIYKPASPLADFIDMFWWYDDYSLPYGRERLLPTGTVELVINLKDETMRIYDRHDLTRYHRFRGPLICGPHARFFHIDAEQQSSIIGIHFKAGGAFPFFGVPIGELQDTHLALETLWGDAAHELRGRLCAAATPEAKFHILEQALLRRSSHALTRHPAITYALRVLRDHPQQHTIASVVDDIGLSARRFIQLFSAEVGLTPKLFHRVSRFQAALRHIKTGQRIEWADLAWQYGYWDQAHLIHDFQA